jgi:hemoglobin
VKQDIRNREDIEEMLHAFYNRAFDDDRIGFFFREVVPIDIRTHVPEIALFWDAVVFGTRGYGKDVLSIHRNIHEASPIRKEHLDRWLELFTGTVNEFFEGEKAELMKQRARSIATMMHIKLNYPDGIKPSI